MSRGIQIAVAIIFSVIVAAFVANLGYALMIGALAHDWSVLAALSRNDVLASIRHLQSHGGDRIVKLSAALAGTFGLLAATGCAVTLLGSARKREASFMSLVELRRAHFFSANTMFLGRHGGFSLARRKRLRDRKTGEVDFLETRRLIGGRYLHAPYFGHVFVSGPTRSGKGAALIIPNALEFQGSMVILDIRGETWDHTAAYRSRFSKVFKFAPAQQRSHGYNPLDFIRLEPGFRESDIINCASGLVASPGLREEYWIRDARELVAGVISYVLESRSVGKRAISTVMDVLLGRDYVIDQLQRILEKEGASLSAYTVSKFNAVLAMGEKQFAGIYGELRQSMRAFTNEFVQRATDTSSFDLRRFRAEAHTVYLDFRLSQIQIMTGIANVMLTQLINFLSDERMKEGEKRVMLMLDEFTTLGKIEPLVPMIKVLAGNGVSVWTFVQSLTDVEAIYDKTGRNSILDNAEAFVFLGGESPDILEYLERQGGKKVEIRKVKRRSAGLLPRHAGTNEAREIEVPLMPRDELRKLSRKDMVILPRGQSPVLARRNYFFADKAMNAVTLAQLPVSAVPDLATGTPPNVFASRHRKPPMPATVASAIDLQKSRITPGAIFKASANARKESPQGAPTRRAALPVQPVEPVSRSAPVKPTPALIACSGTRPPVPVPLTPEATALPSGPLDQVLGARERGERPPLRPPTRSISKTGHRVPLDDALLASYRATLQPARDLTMMTVKLLSEVAQLPPKPDQAGAADHARNQARLSEALMSLQASPLSLSRR